MAKFKKVLKRLFYWLVLPVTLVLAGGVITAYFLLDTIREANDNANWYDPVNGINESYTVTIGGVQQFIQIRGQDRSNPVLVFLHGGPGQPMRALSYEMFRPWTEYFTVVDWDQRGTGASESNADVLGSTINMPQMISDTVEVIEHAKSTLGVSKVILAGHSWGTVLGLNIAKSHPDSLHAYIAFAHGVGFRQQAELVLAEAKLRDDKNAIQGISRVLEEWPNKSDRDGFVASIYNTNYYGRNIAPSIHAIKSPDEHVTGALIKVAGSPDVSIIEFVNSVKNSTETYKPLIDYLYDVDVGISDDIGNEFEIPLIFFKGKHEISTPIVKEWVRTLSAPLVKYIELERSAHLLFEEEPAKILVTLVNEVRPLAQTNTEDQSNGMN